ncbi:MAG: hypothetical protein IT328_13960 [Caldilineaceae bacterium]|nr:hypothetical protein [Caldilineaceae bacterium]
MLPAQEVSGETSHLCDYVTRKACRLPELRNPEIAMNALYLWRSLTSDLPVHPAS